MRVLIGKVFGIGNAVMAIPMIKAIQYKPDTVVDILVGNSSDDFGALQILSKVVRPPGKIYVNSALEHHYDVAVMAIPFDGRWRNGIHFKADQVLDGKTRPDPSTTGLISWKKHESEYQMENARQLGFRDYDPSCSFMDLGGLDHDRIYVGVGYKKDAAGFWKTKHWGNDNYAQLITKILERYPKKHVVTTGDAADMSLSIGPISRLVNDRRFEFKFSSNLDDSFKMLSDCSTYIGNDTGMMHVAASLSLNIIAMFFLPNSIVKSKPLYTNKSQMIEVIDGTLDRNVASVEHVFTKFCEVNDE